MKGYSMDRRDCEQTRTTNSVTAPQRYNTFYLAGKLPVKKQKNHQKNNHSMVAQQRTPVATAPPSAATNSQQHGYIEQIDAYNSLMAISCQRKLTKTEQGALDCIKLQFIAAKLQAVKDAPAVLPSPKETKAFNMELLHAILHPYRAYHHLDGSISHYAINQERQKQAIRLLEMCRTMIRQTDTTDMFGVEEDEDNHLKRIDVLLSKTRSLPNVIECDNEPKACDHHIMDWLLTLVSKKSNIITKFYH